MKDVGLVAALGCGNVQYLVNFVLIPVFNIVNLKLDRIKRFVCYIFMSQGSLEIIAVTELELNILDFYFVVVRAQQYLTLIQFCRESYSTDDGSYGRKHRCLAWNESLASQDDA